MSDPTSGTRRGHDDTRSTGSTTGSSGTDRILAGCGLAYPLLMVVGFVAFPEPPGGDVSAAHDPGWLAAHTGSVIAQSYVRAVAAIAFIVLAVATGRAVNRALRGSGLAALATAGGMSCGLLLLTAQTSTLAAALASRDHVAAGTIPILDGLDQSLLSFSSLPAILLFAAAGIAWHRSATVPGWLAVLTLAGVPLALIDALGYPGGALAGVSLIGLAYFLIWSLAAAACLARVSSPTQKSDTATVAV